jgi:hypothetical protein
VDGDSVAFLEFDAFGHLVAESRIDGKALTVRKDKADHFAAAEIEEGIDCDFEEIRSERGIERLMGSENNDLLGSNPECQRLTRSCRFGRLNIENNRSHPTLYRMPLCVLAHNL